MNKNNQTTRGVINKGNNMKIRHGLFKHLSACKHEFLQTSQHEPHCSVSRCYYYHHYIWQKYMLRDIVENYTKYCKVCWYYFASWTFLALCFSLAWWKRENNNKECIQSYCEATVSVNVLQDVSWIDQMTGCKDVYLEENMTAGEEFKPKCVWCPLAADSIINLENSTSH